LVACASLVFEHNGLARSRVNSVKRAARPKSIRVRLSADTGQSLAALSWAQAESRPA